MINREKYIKNIRAFYDSDLIKIITGIRRCGKSIIMSQIYDEVRSNVSDKDDVIFINFEDKRNLMKTPDAVSLIEYIDTISDKKKYLFFDEIQMVKDWSEACKTLRLSGHSIFITGSNARLLSREFTKELSGRYVSFDVRPLVYKEIVELCKEYDKDISVNDYLIWGGFPKRFEYNDAESQFTYLNDLNETVVINDLIARYKIRNVELFEKFVDFVLLSNARTFSTHSIAMYLKGENIKCSTNTINNYISYLKEAFVIDSIEQYSSKVKRKLQFKMKLYDTDVALNSIRNTNKTYDITHNLENVVYNELLYMGYKVQTYDNAGKEIDFYATKGNMQYFIQVAYSIVDESTYKREMGAFKGIDDLTKKIIITNDDIDFSTSVIRHISLKDFLMLDDLESLNG